MKKLLCLLLTLAMTLSLAACGSKADDKTPRCENGEDVSAKLRVRCLDNYHAQHYNKTHKKPPFAAFLRIGG